MSYLRSTGALPLAGANKPQYRTGNSRELQCPRRFPGAHVGAAAVPQIVEWPLLRAACIKRSAFVARNACALRAELERGTRADSGARDLHARLEFLRDCPYKNLLQCANYF